jgi:hypothetical protein
VPSLPPAGHAHQLTTRTRRYHANEENIAPNRQGHINKASEGEARLLAKTPPSQQLAPAGSFSSNAISEPAFGPEPQQEGLQAGSLPLQRTQSQPPPLHLLGELPRMGSGIGETAPAAGMSNGGTQALGLGVPPLRRCTSIPRLTSLPEELASMDIDIGCSSGNMGVAEAKGSVGPSAWVALDCNPTPAMELLFENQAMRTEREELKQELRMISLRVRNSYLIRDALSLTCTTFQQGCTRLPHFTVLTLTSFGFSKVIVSYPSLLPLHLVVPLSSLSCTVAECPRQ